MIYSYHYTTFTYPLHKPVLKPVHVHTYIIMDSSDRKKLIKWLDIIAKSEYFS